MEVRDPSLDGPMQGSITRVHGLLTSIVSGPMVMPSEWRRTEPYRHGSPCRAEDFTQCVVSMRQREEI
jgi:hypothetical protein